MNTYYRSMVIPGLMLRNAAVNVGRRHLMVASSMSSSSPGQLKYQQQHRQRQYPSTATTLATATTTLTTIRSKHSSTQVKRLFKKNPAKRRVALKQTSPDDDDKDMSLDASSSDATIPETQYPPIIHSPKFLPNGWCPLPEINDDNKSLSTTISSYPFRVTRTANKPQDSVGFLPVYSEYRKDGARVTTRIKKVSGNTDLFLSELRAALQIPVTRNPRDDVIRVRTGGTIEVKGNRVREVKHWLAGLGF